MFTLPEPRRLSRRTIAAGLCVAGGALALPLTPALAQNTYAAPYPYQDQPPPSSSGQFPSYQTPPAYQVPPSYPDQGSPDAYQSAPPAASAPPTPLYPGAPSAGQPAASPYSAPPNQYPYYSYYGQNDPSYYCYYYPQYCSQYSYSAPPYPYPAYPNPGYDYGWWPYGGGVGFGAGFGPSFGFVHRGVVVRRGFHGEVSRGRSFHGGGGVHGDHH